MAWALRNVARPIAKLPGNKDTPLAVNLHADDALIETGTESALALREPHRLRSVQLGLAVFAENRLAVFVF
jgi:hypothetical protein